MPVTAGLLLTGGASARLGAPTAELRRDGERLADRGARLLASVCPTVVELGPGLTALPAVREDPPGSGPLAALVAGADALAGVEEPAAVLLLAVDLPFVEEPLLRWLAEHPAPGAVVPRGGGVPQPLCARYGAPDLDAARRCRAGGAASLRALLDAIPATYVDEDAWVHVADRRALADVDTPDAVARAGLVWPPSAAR